MKRAAICIFLVAAVPAMAIECDFDGDGVTITWDSVEGDYSHLEVWFSPEEIEDSGITVATVEPDESGVFPRTVTVPPAFVVSPEECIGCRLCVSQCPTEAISMVEGKAVIDPDACIACGICAQNCPVDAIYAPTGEDHFALVGIGADGEAAVLERL